jgi:NADH-quinone oxidoreductase subunit M
MLTVLLIGFPLLAGLLVLLSGEKNAKKTAFVLSLLQLGITLFALAQFQPHHPEKFSFTISWIPSLGINFNVAMDGISILLVLLTNLLVPLIVLSKSASPHALSKGEGAAAFYSLILLMQAALVGVFTAMDGFLFYIFWELALLPIWFICLQWGSGANHSKIIFKFFVYTLTGSLFMLVGLIYVYLHTPPLSLGEGQGVRSFDIQALYLAGQNLSAAEQGWVFWAIFIAFAIKMPVFPNTYVTAPTQGTMLLSGIMLKMGTYGLMRWLLPLVPTGVHEWGNVAMILSIIGIIYASILAIMQKDFKRLIAFSSIAHVGLIAAGIFSLNVQGLTGAILQMLAHGVNVVGLFFIADIFFNRTQTREMAALGGIRNIAPAFATTFMMVMLGSVALPITNGFVGEFLLMTGLYQYNAWAAGLAGLSIILGAVYMLRSYQQTMLGETNSITTGFMDLTVNEKAVLIPIIILILAMGVYPKPLVEIAQPAILKLVEQLK